jgi:hypothetical protein
VAHRDQELGVHEERYLPDLHDLVVVDVAHRLQYHEQRLVVDLELRALVRFDRVLHREGVQAELALDCLELLFGRLEQAQPGKGAVVAAGL